MCHWPHVLLQEPVGDVVGGGDHRQRPRRRPGAHVGSQLERRHPPQETLTILRETAGAWKDRDFEDGTEYVAQLRQGIGRRLEQLE